MTKLGRNDSCPCGSGKKYKNCCMKRSGMNLFWRRITGKKLFVLGMLIIILLFSVFSRYYGFSRIERHTFDEGLYAQWLGVQLHNDLKDYSTEKAYHALKQHRNNVPEYLNRPIFKHPPLFAYLIAFSYALAGISKVSAVSVSILFGLFMVAGVFFLGSILYDYRIGLISAFLLSLDPVLWVCSQKIWMETTMSFFMLAAIIFFVLADKKKIFLIVSGICIGLAGLTKYPGFLVFLIIFPFVIAVRREFFKRYEFWVFTLIPFIILLPWAIWNFKVLGNLSDAFIKPHGQAYHFINILVRHRIKLIAICALAFISAVTVFKLKGMKIEFFRKLKPGQRKAISSICVLIVLGSLGFSPVVRRILKDSILWKHTFVVGWSNPFGKESWYFYLRRLPELSPFYLFSYLSILLIFLRDKKDLFLMWCSFCILSFFILWHNFQCRYILPAVPFLIILAARFQVWLYDWFSLHTQGLDKISRKLQLQISKYVFLGVAVYFLIRTIKVDILLALMNSFAYF